MLDPLYKYLNLLKVDDIYKLEIGVRLCIKCTQATHLTILNNSLLPWIKYIPTQPVVLHEERSSGKQQKINTEKDL